MTLHSRTLLHFAAAALVATAFTPTAATAQAATPKLTQSQAGYYRLKVGEVEVIALSDGSIGLDTKLLQTPHRHKVNAALKLAHVASPLDTSVNAYLVKTAGRMILIDAGTGVLFGPSLN